MLMVYVVVADDLAVWGCSGCGRGRSPIYGTGLGDLDRSRVTALAGVVMVSPGEYVHSGIVEGVAVGEESQDVGEPFSVWDLARSLDSGVRNEGE